MSDRHPELSIIAPCLNEEQVLPEFFRRAVSAAEKSGQSFEIIIVDDGSGDGTWSSIAKHSASDPRYPFCPKLRAPTRADRRLAIVSRPESFDDRCRPAGSAGVAWRYA